MTESRFTYQRLVELVDGDHELIARLVEEGLLERRGGDRVMVDVDRVLLVRTLWRELEIDWPGVEVIIRLREELSAARARIIELEGGALADGGGPAETAAAAASTATATAASSAWLLGISGPLQGQRLALGRRLTFGRVGYDADVLIDHATISRRHAAVSQRGEAYVVEDLHSSSGIYVNDEHCAERVLVEGDVISIGAAVFRFSKLPPEP